MIDVDFIITSASRSRTSWLANFFCAPPSLCVHEGVALGLIPKRTAMIKTIGVSDCGFASGFFDIPTEAKGIVVRRGLGDIVRSYEKYFTAHPYPGLGALDMAKMKPIIAKAVEWIGRLKESERLKIVDYDDLNRIEVLEALWGFINPDTKFCQERAEVLDKLRINPMSEKVRPAWHG